MVFSQDDGLIFELEVVEHTTWNSLAQFLEAFTGSSELSHAVDFEFFDLFVHVVQESGEIFWDLLISNEMLGIVSSVKLGDQVFACLVDVLDSFWEPVILFLSILEPNWTKMLELISHSSFID